MLYILPKKIARLGQWRAGASEASQEDGGPAYWFVYVDQKGFEAHRPTSLQRLVESFGEYQE